MSEEPRSGPGEFAAGSMLAGYRLDEPIGQGAMSVVFRAHAPWLGGYVALKILAPGLTLDESFRQRFLREWRAASAVNNPHILPVFEAGEERGALFIAMRYVPGGDIRSLLDREGPLPPGRATEIISQVASALDAAHARGLVHRNVKPANLLLERSANGDRPDHIYLSDFGLSKRFPAAASLPGGPVRGTLDYAAPEQTEGRPVDGRSDLYALACTAFELLTGGPPVRRDQGAAMMYAPASDSPPLSSRRAGLPPEADQVMNRALARSPEDRYANCQEFSTALRRALRPGTAGPDPQPDPQPGPQPDPATWSSTRLPAGTWRPAASLAAGADAMEGAGRLSDSERAALWPADPPTEAASYPAGRRTQPDLLEPAGSPAAPGEPGGPGASGGPDVPGGPGVPAGPGRPHGPGRRGVAGGPGGHAARRQSRRWRRPPAPLAAICAVILLPAAGGYYLFGHHRGGLLAAPRPVAPRLTAPGCTTSVARATSLARVGSQRVTIGGRPFAVRETPDGRFTFVTVGDGIAVLRNGSGLAPTLLRTIHIPGADKGLAVTGNGHYLLAAGGDGAVVISVAGAEQGAADPVVGRLASPHGTGGVGVTISPDDTYAFVTLQNTTSMTVFNLAKALTSGFGPHDFVGYVPLGVQPVGIAQSPDGKWLYATSLQRHRGAMPSEGTLSVISMRRAETKPATSVVQTVNAGCSPARIITDGKTVWVTVRDSNTLLAYSAAALRSHPDHSLLAEVRVGLAPIGLTYAAGDSRIVVADSALPGRHGQAGTLAVVSPAAALAGRSALLGTIPAGPVTRQLTLAADGKTVLATIEGSGQLQAVDVAGLP